MQKKILLLLLSVSCIYSACTDEDLLVPRGVKQPEYVDDSPLVKVAKAYVNGTEGRFSLPDAAVTFSRELTRSSHEPAFTVNNGEVTLEWEKADSYDEGDSEVLTVPIKTKNKMTVYRSITKNNKREKGHTPMYSRLIVRKFKDTDYSYSFVASYVPDRAYMKGNKVKHDKYVNRPDGTHYSGLYIVSELDGRMLYGIRYKEGKEEFRFRPNLEKDFYQEMLQQNPNDTIIQERLKQMKHTSNHLMLKFIGTQALTRASNTGNSNSEYEEVACSTCGGDANECNCYIIYEQYVNNYNENYNESVYEDHCGNNNRDYVYNNAEGERAPIQQSSNNSSQQNYNGGGASNSNNSDSSATNDYAITEVASKLPGYLKIIEERFGLKFDLSRIRFSGSYKYYGKILPRLLSTSWSADIVLGQPIKDLSDEDQLSVLYHEIYHIYNDIRFTGLELRDLQEGIFVFTIDELPLEFYEVAYKNYEFLNGRDELAYCYYTNQLASPEYYLNEINAYKNEIKNNPNVSPEYDMERRFKLYYYEKLYEKAKNYQW